MPLLYPKTPISAAPVSQIGRLRSVYLVPLLPHRSSEKCAAMFWNTLRDMLAGHLVPGDSFYVHYAPDYRNLIGGIAQVVPDGATVLTPANEPDS
jgi:hypothetical protein